MFERLLIANRGEIACRIAATARRLGVATVAVYSDADANALHVDLADDAVRIGPAPAAQSYLRVEGLVAAARASGADALHPGYGFLAESPGLAEACAAAGIVFVGPPPDAIRAMGHKHTALTRMAAAGVPVLPGYHGETQSDAALADAAHAVGWPLLVKPSAGGGGKGMRVVRSAAALPEALGGARREAETAFGDAHLVLERYLEQARHVEVQIFADTCGRVLALGDRDCSVQRRHQKVLEESPAPGLAGPLRARLGEAAVRAAEAIGYVGAGTVEFLVDTAPHRPDSGFFFLEMNTRLQVEHPVTEMVLGLDLVEWQLRVAAGEPLPPWDAARLRPRGHAVEARLYAEDPRRGFLPASGRLVHLRLPAPGGDGAPGADLRVDAGVREGDEVGVHYDPLLAKIVARGEDREQALRRLSAALRITEVAGPATNLPFLHAVLADSEYRSGRLHTGMADDIALPPPEAPADPALLLAVLAELEGSAASPAGTSPWEGLPGWRLNAPATRTVVLERAGCRHEVEATAGPGHWCLGLPGGTVRASATWDAWGRLVAHQDDGPRRVARIVRDGPGQMFVIHAGESVAFGLPDPLGRQSARAAVEGSLAAPMPGRITAVRVAAGDAVIHGQPLVVVEAMKMEHTLVAPFDGTVEQVHCAAGELVAEGAVLVALQPAAATEPPGTD